MCDIHFAVHLKLTQHCKLNIRQQKLKSNKNPLKPSAYVRRKEVSIKILDMINQVGIYLSA